MKVFEARNQYVMALTKLRFLCERDMIAVQKYKQTPSSFQYFWAAFRETMKARDVLEKAIEEESSST